jgi:site-specific DNA-cytosine methylase
MLPTDGRVVSNFIVQALEGLPLTIYGDGSQTRSFCYISDLVEGLILLMGSSDHFTGPVNLGNPGEFTVSELADLVLRLTGSVSCIDHCVLPQDDPKRRRPDITRLVGVPATVMDLFSAGQFADYHSSCADPKAKRCKMCQNTGLPPRDWREITPADVRAALGGQCPDIVFTSPPCKGFSGLLPKKSAGARRYQALNRLTLRSIELALAAFADDPPSLILLENVPGIMQRGRHLVDEMERVLTRAGYAVAKTTHDCGELGGLAQHRRRFLLVARHKVKVPPFLYEPPKLRVRAVGDVLGEMPVPLGGAGGPMHALPELAFQTWLRLALIDAGKDWRCLVGKDLSEMIVQRIGTVELFNGALGVRGWDQPAATVTARAGMYNSASAAVAICASRSVTSCTDSTMAFRSSPMASTLPCSTTTPSTTSPITCGRSAGGCIWQSRRC